MATVSKKRKIADSHYAGRPVQPSPFRVGRIYKAGVSLQSKKAVATSKLQTLERDDSFSEIDRKKRKLLQSTPKSHSPSPLDARKSIHNAKDIGIGLRQPTTSTRPRKLASLKSKSKQKGTGSPTQGARAILEAFVIATPASGPRSLNSVTPATFPPSHRVLSDLPIEVQDLVDLHKAFLSALSLHYAHNGTSSPADVRSLQPSIGRIWGKRKVGPEEIRRVLGVQQWESGSTHSAAVNETAPILSMCDLGNGKICIELETAASEAIISHTAPLPTALLCARFERNVNALQLANVEVAKYPLAPITSLNKNRSLSRVASSNVSKHRFPTKTYALDTQTTTATAGGLQPSPHISHQCSYATTKPASRGASLLDRIRAKEIHAALQPEGPSSECRARRAALLRLEEAIPIIEGLAVGDRNFARALASGLGPKQDSDWGFGSELGLQPPNPTVSFTMPEVVQHLQTSLKQPISREEAKRCVHLLAWEVLPQWVQVKEVGRVVGVSVRGRLRRSAWIGRLREMVHQEETQ